MSHLPASLMNSLIDVKGFDRESFEAVHAARETVVSIRFNAEKLKKYLPENSDPKSLLSVSGKIPWSTNGYYLAERPSFTFDPLFHAGVYYVQEASSMFLEEAIRQTIDLKADLRVLDLCAAPGGKSTLIQSLLSPNSLLVSNEVIKSRVSVLEENMTKWGAANTIITNNDPKDFARVDQFFDLIVVDAPCSGSGLFRRDTSAIEEWSEQNVQLCSQRQQRIISDCWTSLKENGVLIYSTCSFSKEEDEDILHWMLTNLGAKGIRLAVNPEWNIVESTTDSSAAFGYRFWPNKLKGEGFFICCVRKESGMEPVRKHSRNRKFELASKSEQGMIAPWLLPDYQVIKQGESLFAWPTKLNEDLQWLAAQSLYIKQVGIRLGKIAGNDLVPDHALALSNILSERVVAISLKYEEAIQYLRKEEVPISQLEGNAKKGWSLVSFNNFPMGWVKVLANRVNNYYPKEWRILKK